MKFKRCYGCMAELETEGAVCPHCGYDNTNGPADQPSHALPCGTVLNGKYITGRSLGQGGFGITYIGYDLNLELPVCIKEYFPSGAAMRSSTQSGIVLWSGSEDAQRMKQSRESFLKEAQKAVKLRDLTHVVSVWDVFYENETAYIVMDYIKGETLKNRMVRTQQTLSEKACVDLLAPVMEDLDAVHARGIIHRDIKPDNIMLLPSGEPVLLDMGAAKDLAKAAHNGNAQSSTMVVSQGFSPREQYRSKGNIGPWTDVYAMCATILYCVSGKVPPTPMDRDDGENLDLSMFSPAAAKALEKGMAQKAEERYQSMGELLSALNGRVTKPRPVQNLTESGTQVPDKKKSRLPQAIGAAAVAVLLFFGGMKFAGHRSPAETEVPTRLIVEEDIAESAPETNENAEELFSKGLAYEKGDGMEQSFEKAAEFYQLSAALGNSDAMARLGMLYFGGVGVERDFQQAKTLFQAAAEAGNAAGMNGLGAVYQTGLGAKRDLKKAAEWFLKAADGGNLAAIIEVADMYNNAIGVKWDPEAAERGFQRAAEMLKTQEPDDLFAMNNVGVMYSQGQGVARDKKAAVDWYQKSAELGNPVAFCNLASMYTEGAGVEKNYSLAMELALKSADLGYGTAMYFVGAIYGNGWGVEKNPQLAVEWYQKAADAGSDWGMYSLGYCYFSGDGVTQDYSKCLEWYQKAAELGNTDAMNAMGVIYGDGYGVTKDYAKCLEWYQKAADAGNNWGMYNLGFCYLNGQGVTRDYTKAMEWYQKAAELGNAEAMNMIGRCYYEGYGVTKDYAKSTEWFRKAADAGNSWGMHNLGFIYYYGDGVEQDWTTALEWFKKGAEAGNADCMHKLAEMYQYGQGTAADSAKADEWNKRAKEAGYTD